MSPFVIFAIVLTLAYIIYYGVMISRDLTMKPCQEETNEETIEVDAFAQTEEPEPVKSVGDGFQVGDGPVYQPEPEPEVISLDSEGNVKEEGIVNVLDSEFAQKVGEAVETMEDTEPESQPQFDEEAYAKQMEKKHGYEVDEPQDAV